MDLRRLLAAAVCANCPKVCVVGENAADAVIAALLGMDRQELAAELDRLREPAPALDGAR